MRCGCVLVVVACLNKGRANCNLSCWSSSFKTSSSSSFFKIKLNLLHRKIPSWKYDRSRTILFEDHRWCSIHRVFFLRLFHNLRNLVIDNLRKNTRLIDDIVSSGSMDRCYYNRWIDEINSIIIFYIKIIDEKILEKIPDGSMIFGQYHSRSTIL